MQLNSILHPAAMFNRMQEVTNLLFKGARVRVEFTREAWQQLRQLHPSTLSAFTQTINIKADLGLYIASYEERGIRLDIECQQVCYQPGMFLIMRKKNGVWYITDIIVTGEDVGFIPVFMWTRIKRGVNVLAARVLICWRRLVKRTPENNLTVFGGNQHE
ncbi:MAG: hypothetical protein IJH38_01355 [Clostridia bacterium]|nr:hypothetical protein [Clostridia bacterium]